MKWLWAVMAIIGAMGLLENYRISDSDRRRQMFVFYTNLSNLALTVYYLLLAVIPGRMHLADVLQSPLWRISMVWIITVTFLTYHFAIAPSLRKLPVSDGQSRRFYSAANIMVHYLFPLLALAEWVIFAEKGGVTVWEMLRLCLIPLVYCTFILIRPHVGGGILRDMDSFYPYPFIDVDRLSRKRIILNVALFILFMFLLGLAFLGLSALLGILFG